MLISDVCIKRPVFASVISLLLIVFGIIAFDRLPLREYPDFDSPIISIFTNYPGAAAGIVENRVTQLIEDRIAGLEGIKYIQSASQDGVSRIQIEFDVSRNIDDAANDVRDRISRVVDDLPREAEIPDVRKIDSNENVILWMTVSSDRMTLPELTDHVDRYLSDRFSTVDGVARVVIGGGQNFAMRIWVDRVKLAAYELTIDDIENSLRKENIELPAGSIESDERQFSVRVKRLFVAPEKFSDLVLKHGDDGKLVRLGDVAKVVKGTEEHRLDFKGNGKTIVGIGIIKQSTANTIDVARGAKEVGKRLQGNLIEGMTIHESYDSSVFIESAISEVYKTLFIAIGLVIFVIYLFLGSARAMLVPAVTVPVSIIATFIILSIMGFTVNLLTLLALVLGIGLVVDDAIVVLENIHRRMEEYGESALVAAFKGTRQVGFAVIATTAVLISVFAPITVMEGDIGRLFSEFAITMSASVFFSSLVALTLSPVIASLCLKQSDKRNKLVLFVDRAFNRAKVVYKKWLEYCLARPLWIVGIFFALIGSSVYLAKTLPSEYTVQEDRGAYFIIVNGPEGATYNYMKEYMDEIDRRLRPLLDSGDAKRILVRTPFNFSGNINNFNSGFVIVVLNSWGERRSVWDIMDDSRQKLEDLPGITSFAVAPQALRGGSGSPFQFVIGGGTYEELSEWRDTLLAEVEKDNPGFIEMDSDYKANSPQVMVNIDYTRAAELGVSVQNVGRTLESMLASRKVTSYIDKGEEYDVLIEGMRDQQNSPQDLTNIHVRSERSGELIPLANIVSFEEYATSRNLNRYNRIRAITITAGLESEFTLGEALTHMEGLVKKHLPEHAIIDYKGDSRDYKYSEGAGLWMFALGIFVMFLVMAAQFESYVSPFVITLTVPLALAGGLFGLYVTGNSLNLFSQIGLVMLIGLAAKNGILLVEFANQLRDEGRNVYDAITEASAVRLRPIVMTSVTTVVGALPLIISFGAGSETRSVLGITLFSGVLAATIFTLFVVPVAYNLLARFGGSPKAVAQKLERELTQVELKEE